MECGSCVVRGLNYTLVIYKNLPWVRLVRCCTECSPQYATAGIMIKISGNNCNETLDDYCGVCVLRLKK